MADRLRADMVAAMKAREKEKLSVLRMLIAAIKDAAIEKRDELDDEEVTRLLMSYAKKREESRQEAQKLGREDLVAKEGFELEVVRGYLPTPLSDHELQALVDEVVTETGASSIKDMGRVMKLLQERAAGRADGSRISAVVKSRLAG
jgi:hypothetical protein